MSSKFLLSITAVMLAALLALACSPTFFSERSREAETEATPETATPAEEMAEPVMAGAFDAEAALASSYGHFDPATQRVRWRPGKAELRRFGLDTQLPWLYTSVLFSGEFEERGARRSFLLTSTTPLPEDCPACAPLLGGAVYTLVEGVWRTAAESRFITRLNAFDRSSRGRIVRLGPQKHGVLFHWSFSEAGRTETGDVLIAEVNRTLRELLALTTGGAQTDCADDADACWAYESKLTFLPGANPAFYDLVIATTGARPAEAGVIAQIAETRRYVFSNGRYTPRRERPRY